MLLKKVFYLVVFTLSLGQFAALTKSETSTVYLFDLVAIGFVAYGLFYFIALKKSFKVPKVSLPFLGFTFVALLSLVWNFPKLDLDQEIVAFSYLLRWVIYLFTSMVVYNMLVGKVISKKELIDILVYSGMFISLVGFAQLVLLPDFETLDPSLGWDPHKHRLTSTFFDPNFVGGYLCLCLALLLENFEAKKLIPLAVLSTALLLAFSRSSWAMFAVIIFIYGVFKYRKLLLLSFLIGFLAYFAVPRIQTRFAGVTDPADSAHFRLISWKNTLEVAKDNLFLGVGFNAFRFAQKDYGFFEVGELGGHSGAGSDSSFLLILATTGVVGLAVFGLGYFGAITSVGTAALLGGLFVHSQFVNALFYPQIMFLWLVMIMLPEFSKNAVRI